MFRYEELANYTLDEWVREFNEIYHPVNRVRNPSGILLYLVEHPASIHEDLRTADYAGVISHLPRVFCWLCAFTTKASQSTKLAISPSLEEIVLNKFPKQCFYCGNKICTCQSSFGPRLKHDSPQKKALKEERRANARKAHAILVSNGEAPRTLPEFVEMFDGIYGHKNYDTPVEIIAAHFQEEVGEVCEAVNKMYDQILLGRPRAVTHDDLEEEMADTFTWLVALYWKIDYILGGAGRVFDKPQEGFPSFGRSLQQEIWDVYADKSRRHMVDPVTQQRPVPSPVTVQSESNIGE